MRRNRLAVAGAAVALVIPLGLSVGLEGSAAASSARQTAEYRSGPRCPAGPLCAEIYTNPRQGYVGHDEPSVLFYSRASGSGNNVEGSLTLPKDGLSQGSTRNFELHPAFWYGMAMCDNQSAPNPGGSAVGPVHACKADSDSNIYTSTSSSSPRYIGLHPGTAFMELQFYPPGWVLWPPGDSCNARHYCAALNIDSLSENENTGAINNADCFNYPFGGLEPVNFAFVTKNGVAQGPANPVDATAATYTPNASKDLFMSPGDTVNVRMHDTAAGFRVVLTDLTTHEQGSMTASVANGFGHVIFAPNAKKCRVTHESFHPAYASSMPDTRVPWAAHSYNVAFSDEIGHFESCQPGAVTNDGECLASSDDPESSDFDDVGCFRASQSSFYKVAGCLTGAGDADFDGKSYQLTWPGTLADANRDRDRHGTPIRFTSLRFTGGATWTNFSRVAFETDLPRIEDVTTPPCQRHVLNPRDTNPGQGCRGLPAGARFYPVFTTRGSGGSCQWQEGGALLPGTTRTFGGTSTTEFGDRLHNLIPLAYPATGGTVTVRYNDYRNVLGSNPCPAH